jgi:hypothetical protein
MWLTPLSVQMSFCSATGHTGWVALTPFNTYLTLLTLRG